MSGITLYIYTYNINWGSNRQINIYIYHPLYQQMSMSLSILSLYLLPSGYLTEPWKIAHLQMFFSIKTSIYNKCSIAMLNNQMVYIILSFYQSSIIILSFYILVFHKKLINGYHSWGPHEANRLVQFVEIRDSWDRTE